MTAISCNPGPPYPARIELRTTQFSLFFEPETAFVRRISAGGVEVLRAIYGAVRDHHWDTAVPVVSNLRVGLEEDSFRLAFDAHCVLGEVDFFYRGEISGNGGELTFSFDGEARSTFRRNRIGFCVLHPIEGCAGNSCELLKVDGSIEQSAFPEKISPHQPFLDLRGMRWEPARGLTAELGFSGDVFETEDQRNWTDASFKTYCTPLSLPRPVEMLPGTRVRQEVTLRISGSPAITQDITPENSCTVTVGGVSGRKLPPVGFGMPGHGKPPDARSVKLLSALKPAHLRVDLHLHSHGWKEELRRAATDALAVGTALHCALFISDSAENELVDFAGEVLQAKAPVKTCFIFHRGEPVTPARWLELAERRLRAGGMDAGILGGTNFYFTDLNRNRPEPGKPVAFSFNPQVHAFDDLSLVENLEGQFHVASNAVEFTGASVAISPVTLLPRRNGAGAGHSANADLRQRTGFGAVWTLGSLATVGQLPGIHSLTYYETTGCCGLIETAAGSSTPEIFPVYRVFEAIAGCHVLLGVRVDQSGKIAALGVIAPDGHSRLLLGNLLPGPQTIHVRTASGLLLTRHLPGYGLEIIDLAS